MNINLYTWYGQRELDICPKHFIRSKTPVTDLSKEWILERLNGRFCVDTNEATSLLFMDMYPAFEDPQEAVMYELTWG